MTAKQRIFEIIRLPAALVNTPLAAFLAASVVLFGCSGEKPGNEAPRDKAAQAVAAKGPVNLETGKAVYEKYCHFCHGIKGMGDGPVGMAITPHPADFVNDTKRMSRTDEELFKSITKGVHRDIGGEEMAMPRWQDILTDQERRDVLAYIRHLGEEGRKARK